MLCFAWCLLNGIPVNLSLLNGRLRAFWPGVKSWAHLILTDMCSEMCPFVDLQQTAFYRPTACITISAPLREALNLQGHHGCGVPMNSRVSHKRSVSRSPRQTLIICGKENI